MIVKVCVEAGKVIVVNDPDIDVVIVGPGTVEVMKLVAVWVNVVEINTLVVIVDAGRMEVRVVPGEVIVTVSGCKVKVVGTKIEVVKVTKTSEVTVLIWVSVVGT
jgi:hypothetical protein